MQQPLLIQGHRGARGLRPENTLPSFEAALDAGAGSIETDVHLTADGVPVLIHNPVLPTDSRTRVEGMTIEQVRKVVVDRNPDPMRYPNQSSKPMPLTTTLRGDMQYFIPTLADLYEFISAYADEPGRAAGKTDVQCAGAYKVIIDVELKSVPFSSGLAAGRVERAIIDVIRKADAFGRTWVRNFDHRSVRRLRQLEPRLMGVVLIEGTAPVDPVALVRAADAQVYAPDYQFLDEEQVRQCHAAGIQVMPWTVNEPEDWARLITWGVDGITTDYPDRLAQWLAQPPASAK